jgi:hypothetical protein
MLSKLPSAFYLGQRVRVRRGRKGRRRIGTVRLALWQFIGERYDYYLDVAGVKDPTRYAAGDLECAESA